MRYNIEIHSTNGRIYNYDVTEEQLEDLKDSMDERAPLVILEEKDDGNIMAVLPFHSIALFMSVPVPEEKP